MRLNVEEVVLIEKEWCYTKGEKATFDLGASSTMG